MQVAEHQQQEQVRLSGMIEAGDESGSRGPPPVEGGGQPTKCQQQYGSSSNTPLHQPIETFELDVSDSDDAVEPYTDLAVPDDQAWWSEVEAAMQDDRAANGFFAEAPTIASLEVNIHSTSCHCGKLPHLCTCEYYRALRRLELQGVQQLEIVNVTDSEEAGHEPVKRRRITGKQGTQSA